MNKNVLMIPLASLAAVGIVVLATQIAPLMAPPAPHLSCQQPVEPPAVTRVAPTPPPPRPTTIPMRPTMPRPQSTD
jgi:hypothetical protein